MGKDPSPQVIALCLSAYAIKHKAGLPILTNLGKFHLQDKADKLQCPK